MISSNAAIQVTGWGRRLIRSREVGEWALSADDVAVIRDAYHPAEVQIVEGPAKHYKKERTQWLLLSRSTSLHSEDVKSRRIGQLTADVQTILGLGWNLPSNPRDLAAAAAVFGVQPIDINGQLQPECRFGVEGQIASRREYWEINQVLDYAAAASAGETDELRRESEQTLMRARKLICENGRKLTAPIQVPSACYGGLFCLWVVPSNIQIAPELEVQLGQARKRADDQLDHWRKLDVIEAKGRSGVWKKLAESGQLSPEQVADLMHGPRNGGRGGEPPRQKSVQEMLAEHIIESARQSGMSDPIEHCVHTFGFASGERVLPIDEKRRLLNEFRAGGSRGGTEPIVSRTRRFVDFLRSKGVSIFER